MNDNNFNSNDKYRATRNFNTELESPQFNVNDTFDVNIQNSNNDNYVKAGDYNQINNNYNTSFDNSSFNNNVNTDSYVNNQNEFNSYNATYVNNNNSFISSNRESSVDNNFNDNMISNNDIINGMYSSDNNQKVIYTPTSTGRKKKVSFTISPELRILVVLVIILLVFIFLMPTIYDLFNGIRLSVFGGR